MSSENASDGFVNSKTEDVVRRGKLSPADRLERALVRQRKLEEQVKRLQALQRERESKRRKLRRERIGALAEEVGILELDDAAIKSCFSKLKGQDELAKI